MGVGDQGDPLGAGLEHRTGPAVGVGDVAAPAVAVRAGIARVVQREQDQVMAQRLPIQFAGMRAGQVPAWVGQPVAAERFDGGGGRPGRGEGREQMLDRLPDAGVGVEADLAGGVIDQPDRQRDDQFAAGCLGQDAALQPGADEVQFGL